MVGTYQLIEVGKVEVVVGRLSILEFGLSK